jgi:release factor glutamine methyltransferase
MKSPFIYMSNSKSIKDTLLSASAQLKTEEAKLEAQFLLQYALNVNRAWLIAHENDVLQTNIHEAYRALISRRLKGEPMAYILGFREFYGLKLKVTPNTLIPRPDTETLVEAALAKIPSEPSFRQKSESSDFTTLDSDFCRSDALKILDLGTGTGAIALAIAKRRPQAFIVAVDASQVALDVAIGNAENLNITNINFVLSDWFSALSQDNYKQNFDVIVSNPPYIEVSDIHLTQGDLRFEPIKALASGADGLDAIRTIITNAPQHLNPHGWLLLEHGYNQAESVASLLQQAGFTEISHAQDLAGIQRVTMGQW